MSMIKDQEEMWKKTAKLFMLVTGSGWGGRTEEGSEAGWEGQWKGKRRNPGKTGR